MIRLTGTQKRVAVLAIATALSIQSGGALAQAADPCKSPTAQAMIAESSAIVGAKLAQADGDFDISQMLPSKISCMDMLRAIDFSSLSLSGSIAGLARKLVQGLVDSLVSQACQQVESAWQSSMQQLNSMTSVGANIPGVGAVGASLINFNGGTLSIGPNVTSSNSNINSYLGSSTSTTSTPVNTGIKATITEAASSAVDTIKNWIK